MQWRKYSLLSKVIMKFTSYKWSFREIPILYFWLFPNCSPPMRRLCHKKEFFVSPVAIPKIHELHSTIWKEKKWNQLVVYIFTEIKLPKNLASLTPCSNRIIRTNLKKIGVSLNVYLFRFLFFFDFIFSNFNSLNLQMHFEQLNAQQPIIPTGVLVQHLVGKD